ncbi:NHL repeat-containing protein [Thalassoglobus polymorphus]|uniref:NHL repeat protein n=1 Tax=Thalassoglobus polymorphus TaxID=2527994 RepID=A0A517QNP6_9PLAN|nr:peptidase [Thalassoglobus polymorphus]QDT33251.1 NHL repeat protein [Thalassoglobus polymorphus]
MSRQQTRRAMLKTSAATAIASVTAPMFLNASDKAGVKSPVVGTGEHVYESVHDWGSDALPNGHSYGGASHGVAVDQQGLIYITHQGGPDSIFVFDADGKFVKSMGKEHQVKNRGKGHGIDIRKEGSEEFLYLAPSDKSLFFTKMTLKGEVVWNRGRDQLHKDSGVLGPKVSYRPTNTSFRPDGGYYLGDGYGSNYIFEYDKDDKFVRVLGGKGSENGKFSTPHGQWLDDRDGVPKLVVADRANKRLQWFDLDGNHLNTLDGFLFPADIDTQGELMLVPDLHARITILDKNNSVLAHLGDDATWREQVLGNGFAMRKSPAQWKAGKFVHPHDACFDMNNDIFCVEWVVGGRVTKLVKA